MGIRRNPPYAQSGRVNNGSSNVRSFGTEGRRPLEVPMSNEIYDFIIFRGKDLKDLTVLQGAPERSVATGPELPESNGGSMYSNGGPSSEHSGAQTCSHAPVSTLPSSNLGSLAPTRNGFPCLVGSPPLTNSYSVGPCPNSGSSGSRPTDKNGGTVHSRRAFPSSEPHGGTWNHSIRAPHYEDSNGMDSSRGTSEEAKVAVPRSGDVKDRPTEAKDQKARGRGKGGSQKKPLHEVLRYHKRAEETIVKTMRNQSSASLGPVELRALSEMHPSVYHFYIDFVNYCGPSHMVQSDEQQWEMLCKALKKHFEKDFGANQNPKPAQPQRPNNTLGDFITGEANSKPTKKNAKVTRGGRVGRGTGRGEKKEACGQVSGECDGPGVEESPTQSASWVCPRCTLKNESSLFECGASGTSKQQAALWAEFPPLG